jgi:hypothetical protein
MCGRVPQKRIREALRQRRVAQARTSGEARREGKKTMRRYGKAGIPRGERSSLR